MRWLLLLAILLQRRDPRPSPLPADLDAATEARASETQLLINDHVRVAEVKFPQGVKALHFAPERAGFFILGGTRIIWQHGPVILKTDAIHVELLKPVKVTEVTPKDGVLFENSAIRVKTNGRGEGGELRWIEKERVLLIKQSGQRLRIELKYGAGN